MGCYFDNHYRHNLCDNYNSLNLKWHPFACALSFSKIGSIDVNCPPPSRNRFLPLTDFEVYSFLVFPSIKGINNYAI